MKNLIILLILVIVGFSSCDKVNINDAKRVIINSTPYEVQIKVWGDDIEFVYEVGAIDTLIIEGTCQCCVPRACSIGWTSDLAFATIIFDDEKVQKFKDLPSDSSIKSINADPDGGGYGYILTRRENGIEIYTYEITQEDYDNAEDIGG